MSEENKGYNGFSNYPTWNVALWIGNEEPLHREWECDRPADLYREAVRDQLEEFTFEPGENPTTKINREEAKSDIVHTLATELKDHFTGLADDMLAEAGQGSSFFADLLGYAMGEVNWHEIATNYVSEIDFEEIEKEVAEEFAIEPEEAE